MPNIIRPARYSSHRHVSLCGTLIYTVGSGYTAVFLRMIDSDAMMRWTIREVARAKGIKSARELGEKAGIAPNSIYKLWRGTATMVGLGTLERLCSVLEVLVGMLLQHIPEDQARNLPTEGPTRGA